MEVKSLRNRKGYLRIIEIALAAVLVFSYLIFVTQINFGIPVEEPKFDKVVLKNLGEDVLKSFDLEDSDSDGLSDLRTYVIADSWEAINDELNSQLPPNVGYTLYQYSAGTLTYKTGTAVVDIPTKRDLVSVNYVLFGDNGAHCKSSLPCSLNLVLWFEQ